MYIIYVYMYIYIIIYIQATKSISNMQLSKNGDSTI